MKFCNQCGAPVQLLIPAGDHLPRHVCDACGAIHYENPRLVVGCVAEHEGRILLCRRAIEPRRGYWTVPAGFMENGETLQEAAARESREEALAEVTIGSLLSVVHVLHAEQVHVFFRAALPAAEPCDAERVVGTRPSHDGRPPAAPRFWIRAARGKARRQDADPRLRIRRRGHVAHAPAVLGGINLDFRRHLGGGHCFTKLVLRVGLLHVVVLRDTEVHACVNFRREQMRAVRVGRHEPAAVE